VRTGERKVRVKRDAHRRVGLLAAGGEHLDVLDVHFPDQCRDLPILVRCRIREDVGVRNLRLHVVTIRFDLDFRPVVLAVQLDLPFFDVPLQLPFDLDTMPHMLLEIVVVAEPVEHGRIRACRADGAGRGIPIGGGGTRLGMR